MLRLIHVGSRNAVALARMLPGEDDLRFEVGVKSRVTEAELVLVVLSMLNS